MPAATRRARSRRPSRASSPISAWARASSTSSCASASRGRPGTDEAVFLVRPNAGLPLAPVAETASGGELSRIALAIAAVAGGETVVLDEIDAGVGGVTAHRVADVLRRLAERAQVLTITHLPQIASVADQHLRVEKVPGDPTHTRIAVLDDARAARRARAHARRRGVRQRASPRTSAAMNGEITGRARLGRRTKDLVKRLGPQDVAIVDHADIDRVSAEELAETGVRAVVNVSRVDDRALPEPGPARARPRGRPARRRAGRAALRRALRRRARPRSTAAASGGTGRSSPRAPCSTPASLEEALADQQGRVSHALEAFAENTLRHLREEAGSLAAGIELPDAAHPLPRPARARRRPRARVQVATCGWCARTSATSGPCSSRSTAARTRSARSGSRPDVIVGDFDSVSDAALRGGRRARRARLPERRGTGRASGCGASACRTTSSSAPGISEDLALQLAYEKGATLIVAVGTHFNLVEFLERDREGMASTFVTRLKVGESLVDAKGVSRLVSPARRASGRSPSSRAIGRRRDRRRGRSPRRRSAT